MSTTKYVGGSSKSHQAREIEVAPVTRAVRAALAVSVATLALGGTAVAGTAPSSAPAQVATQWGALTGLDAYPVDLTLVQSGGIPSSVVASPIAPLSMVQAGDITYTNAGTIAVSTTGAYNANAIDAESTDGGNVSVDNQATGVLTADSQYGNAIGIFGYTVGGNVNEHNAGQITTTSTNGLADGIFASGGQVAVTTDAGSSISATGFNWAAGIEAQGDDLTTVNNAGDITATANANDETNKIYGHAFGIYTTGGAGGISVANSGTINATGLYATGIYAYDATSGKVAVTNSGKVLVTSGYFATGIQIASGGDGAVVTVDNSGTVYAGMGGTYISSIGIQAVATGAGSSVSVDNSGTVMAMNASDSQHGQTTGILASATGDASVDNSGAVVSNHGDGIQALAFTGNASVTNSGSVGAAGTAITAASQGGTATVVNSGSVRSLSTGIRAGGGTGASVDNSGSILVGPAKYGFGVYASAGTGDAVVTNSGSLTLQGMHAYGAIGKASVGNTALTNSGSVAMQAKYGYGLVGSVSQGDVAISNTATGTIDIKGKYTTGRFESVGGIGMFGTTTQGDVTIGNAGSVSVDASGGGKHGIGVFARSREGNVAVSNSGTLYASAYYDAQGVRAQAKGDVAVDNSGTITTVAVGGYGHGHATGVLATATGGTATIHNSGAIAATADYGIAIGISTSPDTLTAQVDNSGQINAASFYYGIGVKAGGGTVGVTNSGSITVESRGGIGVEATAASGNATVVNSGSILASDGTTHVISDYYGATAVTASSAYGTALVSNSGSITATAATGTATGVQTMANTLDAQVANAAGGTISASGAQTVTGVLGEGTTLTVTNAGQIAATTDSPTGQATGVWAKSSGDATIGNSGSIAATGVDAATALALDAGGVSTLNNSGSIAATAPYGTAIGVHSTAATQAAQLANAAGGTIGANGLQATGLFGEGATTVAVTNAGQITATGVDTATALALNAGGASTLNNAGSIAATAPTGTAIGVHSMAGAQAVQLANAANGTIGASGLQATGVLGEGATLTVANAGHITATSSDAAGQATGLWAKSSGDATISNSGSITATGVATATAVALNAGGVSTLNNSGVIRSYASPEGSIAVSGGDGVENIVNTGKIYGALVLGGGADNFTNANRGLWDVRSHSTDFGAGNDVVNNQAGGTILLADSAISLGSGNNAFTNAGLIKIVGNSLIDMGTGPGSATPVPAMSTAQVPALNATPMINNGVIDFLDGATNDALTVHGNFGGNGTLNLDLNLRNGTSDMLRIDGDVVAGTVQRVNMPFTGIPTAGATVPAQFASVAGTSTADQFVAGRLTGYSPNNFVNLGIGITSKIDPSNATADAFYAQIAVTGLSDAGTLAASAGQSAQSLMASQIGTWRQRMGVVPAQAGPGGVSPWVRRYYDNRDVKLSHTANFGSGGNFAYEQTNAGTELGLDVAPMAGINLGIMLADNKAEQRLTGSGAGSSRLDGHTVGLYGTYTSAKGYYVDLSYRTMGFKSRLRSPMASEQLLLGRANALNVEAGYDWTFGNGLVLEPQLQYTRTMVDGMGPLQAVDSTFHLQGARWETSRVGVAALKQIGSAHGWIWTPYGALSLVHVAGNHSTYAVNDTLFGSTSSNGDSAMAELGLGVRRNNLSVTAGVNWVNGGATQGQLGGQVVLRYGF